MSFVIDEQKVKELTAAIGRGAYRVSTSPLEANMENYRSLYGASGVVGTGFDFSAVSAETRRRLLAIRRRIEESGEPLKSVEQLTLEIDERRGRTR